MVDLTCRAMLPARSIRLPPDGAGSGKCHAGEQPDGSGEVVRYADTGQPGVVGVELPCWQVGQGPSMSSSTSCSMLACAALVFTGTAQKMVLNTFSTALMVRLGPPSTSVSTSRPRWSTY
jgi:hypothetical protein